MSDQVGNREDIVKALEAMGHEAMLGKDSGFYVRGMGWISLAKARKRTGLKAPERQRRERVAPYGDYAWIRAINRIKD